MAGFVSALAGIAGYWIAFGGIAEVDAKKLRNDLDDVEYIVLGAVSQGLSTEDKRANIVCQAVRQALASRMKWFHDALMLGPEAACALGVASDTRNNC
jgi:hypothetical protein